MNDLRWECSANTRTKPIQSPNYISQFLLVYDLAEIKRHTGHLYKALILSRGAVSWFWVQACPNPRSTDSRFAQAAQVECGILYFIYCISHCSAAAAMRN